MSPEPHGAFIAFEGERRIASGDLREVARAAKQTLDQRDDASILVFDDASSGPIEIDFRGTIEEVLGRLPDVTNVPVDIGRCAVRAARSRPPEAGRGGARNHLVAAALGLAGAATRRRFGCDPQAGRGSAANRRRQGSPAPGARGGLSFHVGHGRQQAALRRRDPCAVCRRPRSFRRIDRRMARRCARPCFKACGKGILPRRAGARRLIRRKRAARLVGMIAII